MNNCNLMLGDCLDLLPGVADNSVDLIVTSPPYDNLRVYSEGLVWHQAIWEAIFPEIYRVVKPGGVVVWVTGDASINGSETGSSFKQALFAMETGFRLHDTMIYKKVTSPFPETTRYYQAFEYMFVFSKGKPKTINLIKDRENKYAGSKVHGTERRRDGSTRQKPCAGKIIAANGVRFNVWEMANPGIPYNSHPAVFPEKLAEDHILSWSSPGDIVMDIFMGSGTTGKMALRNGRDFIGIEKSEKYMNIAKRRIQEA